MLSSLARGSIRGLVVRALGLGLAFGVTLVLARLLTVPDLGLYQGVLSAAVILAGLASAFAERPATRAIAISADRAVDGATDPASDGTQREILAAHAVTIVTVVTVTAFLGAVYLLPGLSSGAKQAIALTAVLVPGLALLALRQWIALPLQGVAASIGPEQVALPVIFLLLLAAAHSREPLGPTTAVLLYAAACWVVWTVACARSGVLATLRRGLRQHGWSGYASMGRLRRRFQQGRVFATLTALTLVPTYATVPIVGALGDLADAGQLAVALQLSAIVAVPLHIVSLASMPRGAQLHAQGEHRAMANLVRDACGLSLALGVMLATVLVLVLGPLLRLFGPAFADTAPIVLILIGGQLVNAAFGPNGHTLQMIGFEHDARRVEGLATVLRVGAVAVAAVSGSLVAVAVAIAATSVVRNVLLTVALHHRTGIISVPRPPRRRARVS